MKHTNYSFAGGFPLTQDRLKDIQDAHTQGFHALATVLGEDALIKGVILSGMEYSLDGTDVTISDGYFACKVSGQDAKIIRLIGATIACDPIDAIPVIEITTDTTNLLYRNGILRPSIAETVGDPIAAVIGFSPTPGFQLIYTDMVRYGQALGENHRDADWLEMEAPGGGVGDVIGTLYYKKDWIANTLHIKGSLKSLDPLAFTAPPGVEPVYIGTFEYVPNIDMLNLKFMGVVRVSGGLMPLPGGGSYVQHVTCEINSDGDLVVNFIQPDATIGEVNIDIGVIVPLG